LIRKFLRNKITAINNSRKRLVESGMVKYSSDELLSLTGKAVIFKEIERNSYKIDKPKGGIKSGEYSSLI